MYDPLLFQIQLIQHAEAHHQTHRTIVGMMRDVERAMHSPAFRMIEEMHRVIATAPLPAPPPTPPLQLPTAAFYRAGYVFAQGAIRAIEEANDPTLDVEPSPELQS